MKQDYPGKIPTEQLASDYASGMTVRQIAQKYGTISFQAVHERLTNAGYDLDHKRGYEHKYELRICPTCKRPYWPYFPEQVYCQMACKRTENREYCKHGHRLTPDNLTPWYNGAPPRCKTCAYERVRAYQQKKKGQAS